MLDIAFIRDNPDRVKEASKAKNKTVDIDMLLSLDEQRRDLLAQIESLRKRRNEISQSLKTPKPDQSAIDEGKKIKQELSQLETDFTKLDSDYQELLESVPNVFSEDTPIGEDEEDNQVLRQWGDPTEFDFTPKDHVELGKELDLIDVERAAKISGARFNFLKGDLALLQYALVQLVFSIVTDEAVIKKLVEDNDLDISTKPFIPVIPPVLVRPETMHRMARLEPKEDRFLTVDEEYALVGSAEHSLGAMYMDEIVPQDELPLRYIGYSAAFRREAGSYGKDTRGILRQHQFDKLEMETFSTEETGLDEHLLMIALQEHIMQQLELPYQVVAICSGDMGAPDFRQVDIEAWMPGQSAYRETHTADYMGDYQARRLKTRYKTQEGARFVSMNDATALAIGRALIAIMENYQTQEGSIVIPEVLRPYLNKEEIT